jgi:16S rRNA C1402 N4-methylase RsmH
LDPNILEETRARLSKFSDKIEFIGSSYTNIQKIFGKQQVDFVLLDL